MPNTEAEWVMRMRDTLAFADEQTLEAAQRPMTLAAEIHEARARMGYLRAIACGVAVLVERAVAEPTRKD